MLSTTQIKQRNAAQGKGIAKLFMGGFLVGFASVLLATGIAMPFLFMMTPALAEMIAWIALGFTTMGFHFIFPIVGSLSVLAGGFGHFVTGALFLYSGLVGLASYFVISSGVRDCKRAKQIAQKAPLLSTAERARLDAAARSLPNVNSLQQSLRRDGAPLQRSRQPQATAANAELSEVLTL